MPNIASRMIDVSRDEFFTYTLTHAHALTPVPVQSQTVSAMQYTDNRTPARVYAQSVYSKPIPAPGVPCNVRYQIRKAFANQSPVTPEMEQ